MFSPREWSDFSSDLSIFSVVPNDGASGSFWSFSNFAGTLSSFKLALESSLSDSLVDSEFAIVENMLTGVLDFYPK